MNMRTLRVSDSSLITASFQIATLLILKNITINPDIAKNVTDLGAIPNIITILDDDFCTLQKLAAEIIANISKFKKPRKIVRKTGGLPKLVSERYLIDVFKIAYVAHFRRRLVVVRFIS